MKNNISNVNHTVKNKLCLGCGICEDICPMHCITIRRINGEHRPVIDESLCLGSKCSRCLKICPGVGVNLLNIAKEQFADAVVKEDKYIGRYVGLHTGYSLDDEIRYHSASGGMVSQFLIYLLEKKIIDGAVVTGFGADHLTPHSYIATNREEVIAARSSKYCPVALNKVGNELVVLEGKRYVIVGLPCHIQGFRKRAAIDKKFREKIVGYFAIYCSSGRTFYAQDFLLQHYKIKRKDVSYFAFRDYGCLGNLTIRVENSSLHTVKGRELKVPFPSYYGSLLRSFFKPHRCLACIDHYGELADVCFGDIHIAPYDADKIGISSWISRSSYWENLFIKAADEGYIKMDEVTPEILNKSQAAMLYPKKRHAGVVVKMDRWLGRQIPVFDKPYEVPSLKDYVSVVVCHAQRFIGRHPYLWFIIDKMRKESKK